MNHEEYIYHPLSSFIILYPISEQLVGWSWLIGSHSQGHTVLATGGCLNGEENKDAWWCFECLSMFMGDITTSWSLQINITGISLGSPGSLTLWGWCVEHTTASTWFHQDTQCASSRNLGCTPSAFIAWTVSERTQKSLLWCTVKTRKWQVLCDRRIQIWFMSSGSLSHQTKWATLSHMPHFAIKEGILRLVWFWAHHIAFNSGIWIWSWKQNGTSWGQWMQMEG